MSAVTGLHDWHCHLDRGDTCLDIFYKHTGGGVETYTGAPLTVKQNATGILHEGEAYATEDILYARMRRIVEAKIVGGEILLKAITDTSPDIDGRAFRAALRLRQEFAGIMDIHVGAYPIFGFRRHGSDREIELDRHAKHAQFLMGLPERDARADADNNVGFEGHLAILFEFALKYGIPEIQVHVDQTNLPTEDGTERLVEATKYLLARTPPEKRPHVWAVHMISPSGYEEDRFWALVQSLKTHNIGVVVCPHAALSMRQLRNSTGPMRNSIARVKELIAAGIEVRLGTDNINDIFMPDPKSPLILREAGPDFGIIQSATRFYDQGIWNKIMCGIRLNELDRYKVSESLKGDYNSAGTNARPWLQIK